MPPAEGCTYAQLLPITPLLSSDISLLAESIGESIGEPIDHSHPVDMDSDSFIPETPSPGSSLPGRRPPGCCIPGDR